MVRGAIIVSLRCLVAGFTYPVFGSWVINLDVVHLIFAIRLATEHTGALIFEGFGHVWSLLFSSSLSALYCRDLPYSFLSFCPTGFMIVSFPAPNAPRSNGKFLFTTSTRMKHGGSADFCFVRLTLIRGIRPDFL